MLKVVRPPSPGTVGPEEFRAALSRFASGVTVISTLDHADAVHGMTATAFASLSLDPPLVLVAVAKGSRCHRHILAGKRFGVSILSENQAPLSRHFGKSSGTGLHPEFARLDGLPVLSEAMVKLACELHETAEGGDHTIFIGRVTATNRSGGHPLVHFEGGYHALSKDTR